MIRPEAITKYNEALKRGQKYCRDAVNAGRHPYPPVLDDMISEADVAGQADLGVINIPSALIAGTKSAGRTSAFSGNFMPLLSPDSEFAAKWISLCSAHLGEEGIRDPIKCYEYMGRFYVQEGNKRTSVLLSYGAPGIPGSVTRLIPAYSEDEDIKIYYEFMRFYALAGIYGVTFRRCGGYEKLLAALGMDADHEWTAWERRSFSAGFARFSEAFDQLAKGKDDVTAGEALLAWLKVFSFADIKNLTLPDLMRKLTSIWPDIMAEEDEQTIEISTEPVQRDRNLFSRILSFGQKEHLNVAFIYAFPPEKSAWTRAHAHGRVYLEDALGDRVSTRIYEAYDHNYDEKMDEAVSDGAQVIFATTAPMLPACRRIAAAHPDVKVLTCALSIPYAGIRTYYSRIYECKFITGAIAGAMAENDLAGYIANYPIYGVPAEINAFALGMRMTNPRGKVLLKWSCVSGDPLRELQEAGVSVISNRDATNPVNRHRALEWGTYALQSDGNMQALAVPCWNWGKFYERVLLSIFDGAYSAMDSSRAINYWWGLSSGVVDVQFSDELPEGVRSLAHLLKSGIAAGRIDPFLTYMEDTLGNVKNDGLHTFTPDELMTMDWLCENVDGSIPPFDVIMPRSVDTVRLLGIYRSNITPEKEERQL